MIGKYRVANATYEHHLPGAVLAESALGIPLFPSGFDIDQALSQQPEGRCDVRVKAIDLTLSALTHLLGRRPDEQTPLTQQEQTQLHDHPDIRFVQDLVAVANNVYANETAVPQVEGADDPSTPRAKVQAKLTKGMFEHMQTVPGDLAYAPDTPLHKQFDDTYVVIAPTASGKTVLQARLLREAGIGKKVGRFVKRIMKAVLATSSINLGDQFAGKRGDNTFRRFLGDVDVTRFYGGSHDADGPVVITTDRSMDKLNQRDYTLSVIDEGHLALAPQAEEHIKSIGMRCFMFTATPAYGKKADLRRRFKYVEEGTLRSFVEQGVLNTTRLLTFQYNEHPEMTAAVLAHRYITAGRKVVVYCQSGTQENPGGPSKKVAELVNALQGKHVAQDVGSHNKNSDRDVERFDQDKLKVLATSRMLREGWNADVDVAICIGPHYSMLDLQQKIGRPLRPGRFISELVELVPRYRKANRPMVSLFQLFGLEDVTSGTIVGATDDGKGCLIPPDTSWLFHSDESDDSSAGHDQKPAAPRPRQSEEILDLSTLPKDILENIVVDKPVRSIIMGANHLPTEGFVSSAKMAADYEVPPQFVHLRLDQQGFSYEGLWLPDENDEFRYDRWYEPAAQAYLEANPIPKEAGAMELIAQEGADLCGVSKSFFLKMADLLNITPHDRLNKRRNDSKRYDLLQLVTILAAIEAIPLAAEDDEAVVDLQKELSTGFVPNSMGVYKRRNPIHGISGWCQHVSAVEAAEMREAYSSIPVADETFISTADAAKAADLSLQSFRDNFTDEEKAALLPMRKRPGSHPVDHLPRAVADPLIERLKRDKLEPYFVPFSIILKRVNRSDPALRAWLRASEYEAVPKRITKKPSFCFPWKALQELERLYGRKPGVPVIVFKNLVRDAADFDEYRWVYTQGIQKSYLPPEGIRRMQTLEEAKEKAEQASRGTTPASVVSTAYEDSRPGVAGIPVKAVSERQTPPAKPTSVPLAAPDIPEDYVDLDEYLDKRGLACEPSIARILARRHSLPAPIIDNDERLWVSDLTAMTLEEAIAEYEPAQPGVLSPQQIADLFLGAGLTGKHITHLVSKSDMSLQGQTQICRELRADGSAGALCLHYDLALTSRVRGLLSGVIRDPARLEALRKFADQI